MKIVASLVAIIVNTKPIFIVWGRIATTDSATRPGNNCSSSQMVTLCLEKDQYCMYCSTFSLCRLRFVQHTARHERLDTLCGNEFEGFRGVTCSRESCEFNIANMKGKSTVDFLGIFLCEGWSWSKNCVFSAVEWRSSEVQQPLPLPEVRLLLHRHEQGRGPQTPTPEAWLDQRRRIREVHPDSVLSGQRLWSQWEADPLPLQQMSIRCPRPVSNGSPQV